MEMYWQRRAIPPDYGANDYPPPDYRYSHSYGPDRNYMMMEERRMKERNYWWALERRKQFERFERMENRGGRGREGMGRPTSLLRRGREGMGRPRKPTNKKSMPSWYCELCDVTMQNHDKEPHLAGKRHKAEQDKRDSNNTELKDENIKEEVDTSEVGDQVEDPIPALGGNSKSGRASAALCFRFHEHGDCEYGDDCIFSHDAPSDVSGEEEEKIKDTEIAEEIPDTYDDVLNGDDVMNGTNNTREEEELDNILEDVKAVNTEEIQGTYGDDVLNGKNDTREEDELNNILLEVDDDNDGLV